MEFVYRFRLSKNTYEKLEMLAEKTQRSRANVVRWLIDNASLHSDLLSPNFGDTRNGINDAHGVSSEDIEIREVEL